MRLVDSALSSTRLALVYKGRNVTKLEVHIAPSLANDTTDGAVRDMLLREVAGFRDELSTGMSAGSYQNYQVAFEADKPIRVGERQVPGYSVAAVLLHGRRTSVSLFYVYHFRGMRITIYLTVPDVNWNTNPALNFATAFIEGLVGS